MILQPLKWIRSNLTNFVYPPLCAACGQLQEEDFSYFCTSCAQTLELICPQARCPHCFSKDYAPKTGACGSCQKRRRKFPWNGRAASFSSDTIASQLIYDLKEKRRWYLAKAMAAYMFIQLERLPWKKPDLIVPAPLPLSRRLSRPYNQAKVLGEALASLCEVPCMDLLYSSGVRTPQSWLGIKERKTELSLTLRKNRGSLDKVILIVDDSCHTASTLVSCAKALDTLYPSALYALTFTTSNLRCP